MHIIWRDSSDESIYETARLHQVFNTRTPHRFPKAIVRAANADDVVAAVKLAIEHDCCIAVRSGGHSFPVWSVHDESILIDLSDLKEITVDAATRTARVSPGIRSEELNEVLTGQYELIFPAGHCPTVGLGGFLLQGGMGWNCSVCPRRSQPHAMIGILTFSLQNWGWACELVDAVELVTAQGELLLCNAQQHPDLFWAARGAGPGTSLHPDESYTNTTLDISPHRGTTYYILTSHQPSPESSQPSIFAFSQTPNPASAPQATPTHPTSTTKSSPGFSPLHKPTPPTQK